MLQVVPFDITHFDQIEWQNAQSHGRAYYQRHWAEEIAQGSDAWSGVTADGYVVGCAGVIPTRAWLNEDGSETPVESMAWAIFSPRLGAHAKHIVRAIRAFLNARPEYRIEAVVDAEHERAAPFLEFLGFQFEREVDAEELGKTMKLFVRVRQ